MYIKRIGLYLILSVIFICLVSCQKKATHEIIDDKFVSVVYKNFVIDPQGEKERLIKHHGQGMYGLLQDILMSKKPPSEKTLKAFSQLFAEVYRNALDDDLSQSDNETHAQILGTIIGGLIGLREQVLEKREMRFLAGWYNYTEFDKRWLALFTDIVSLNPSHELPKYVIQVAHTGDVNKFSESLIHSEYTKQIKKEKDLPNDLIYKIVGTTTAEFNGYAQATERSLGSVFNITRVVAWDDIKSLTN